MQAETSCGELANCETRTPQQTSYDGPCALKHWGWIEAHRLLFGSLRLHLLGWPRSLEQKAGTRLADDGGQRATA